MIARLLPLIGVAVAIAVFFGYISPTYNGKIKELQQTIKDDDKALLAAAHFTHRQDELQQKEDTITPDQMTRLETFLPDGVDNVRLILDLDALAAKSGVTLSNFTVSANSSTGAQSAQTPSSPSSLPLITPSAIDYIDMTVSATGTYSAFRAFLSNVEQSLRPLDLVGLQITDSTTAIYTYQMDFRIYWLH